MKYLTGNEAIFIQLCSYVIQHPSSYSLVMTRRAWRMGVVQDEEKGMIDYGIMVVEERLKTDVTDAIVVRVVFQG